MYWCRFKSCGMLLHVDGEISTGVLKRCCYVILKIKQFKKKIREG